MLSKFFSHRCRYRTQVEELQARFSEMEKLVAKLKIQLEQQQAEITTLKAENAQLKIENAELREKLAKYENPKDSSNSSIPHSQDPYRKKYPKKEKSGLPSGG